MVLTALETSLPLLMAGHRSRSPCRHCDALRSRFGRVGGNLVEDCQAVSNSGSPWPAAGPPEVLLADEPTSARPATADRPDLAAGDAATGNVVVMATHDPEAAAVADRVIRLDEGLLSVER
jgi:predicted ABC-type transport system involved in lysophospholipase L1 biosynthesis ATPase subunit